MEITTALTLEIGRLRQPIVTSYQLGCLIFKLYQTKTYQGEKLARLQKDLPERLEYKRVVNTLLGNGVLQHSKELSNQEIYTVLGQDAAAEDIVCCIDPFCYISHLSAMVYHGLTERLPKMLFITTLPHPQWGQLAIQRMQKDLGETAVTLYQEAALTSLHRLKINKIQRKTINVYTTLHCDPGSYLIVQGRIMRVATIGRTFLDMLREPELCGGIYHVLEIYAAHAQRYLRLIIDVINRHGTKIDKVRAGYILDERLGLLHPIIDSWLEFAQRGGSRKLLANAPYSSRFSEKWCLSINIEEEEV
ncbi:hypothetical protein KEF85_16570 [Methylomonas paludis]|uniref:AbiEi antitoxin C-terminal domain-containing protein n=1 Tax=Methylomonas paludis TaxID=1173101 RepID=A0A975R8Y7_9GAMM|nr:hypothetical protein [Methylomonas paludis]QWF70895.1 hypothetical protein KEF85_16570 [Methylomonas paludis]